MPGLEIFLGADVRVSGPPGSDLTPHGRKDCAVVAMLAMAPSRRRARAWLQDKLWSDRSPERGGMSLRRVLSNIRTSWGAMRPALGSDQRSVWLAGPVEITYLPLTSADDFLGDLGIDDPEFLQWLRETSRAMPRKLAPGVGRRRQDSQAVPIRIVPEDGFRGAAASTVETELIDTLSERFMQLGPVRVMHADRTPLPDPDAPARLDIEVACDVRGGMVQARIRVLSGPERLFLWAGRAQFPFEATAETSESAQAGLVNTVVTATMERSLARFRASPYFRIQHAVKLLFTGQRRDIEAADTVLQGLGSEGTGQPVIPAWRGYQRLTSFLELGGDVQDARAQAAEFAAAALKSGRSNPLVLALAAQMEMKLNLDVERADYLAAQALSVGATHPYALAAAGHAATLLGRHEEGYRLSQAAMACATGLPNAFIWQMQCALSALALGRLDEAYERAYRSHLGMAGYRPALRYLVALSLLRGRRDEAQVFAARLRRIEPGFMPANLLRPDYPLDTLRALGLQVPLADS